MARTQNTTTRNPAVSVLLGGVALAVHLIDSLQSRERIAQEYIQILSDVLLAQAVYLISLWVQTFIHEAKHCHSG